MSNRMLKWSPSYPAKRPDSIPSSDYTNSNYQFIASYEQEEVNMFSLLAMEYGRIWRKESQITTKIILASQDKDFLQRRFVIRGHLLRKQKREGEKRFIMNKFKNVPAKIKIRTPEEIDKLLRQVPEEEKEEQKKN